MKKFLMSMTLLLLTASACAPMQTTSEAPADENPATVPPVATETKQPLGPIEETVVQRLAGNLGLDESEISIVSNETVEFKDACLGITIQEVKCAQATVPGRILILEANNIEYEYHTDRSGKQIQPATLALTWKRIGGIAGFCNNLTVFLSGEVYAYKCDALSDAKIDTVANLLSATEREQFHTWITDFDRVSVDASDPRGVSDRMEVVLEVYGIGGDQPSDAEQQEMIAWAQDLFQELSS